MVFVVLMEYTVPHCPQPHAAMQRRQFWDLSIIIVHFRTPNHQSLCSEHVSEEDCLPPTLPGYDIEGKKPVCALTAHRA